jgi:putative membrane protein
MSVIVASPDSWATAWNGDAWVWAALLLPAGLYARGVVTLWQRAGRGVGISRPQAAWFGIGWIVLAIAMVSPLDALGGQLFWLHMVQHEALMLVAAPMIVVSRPVAAIAWGLPPAIRKPFGRLLNATRLPASVRLLASPAVATVLHGAVLWAWHAPPLLALSLINDWMHHIQHATLMLTALVFWWTVLAAPIGIAWLLATLLHTSVLGALLAFAQMPWYDHYLSTAPRWGLDPLQDQQLAGLVMWVPGGLAYLVGALVLLARLLNTQPVTSLPSAHR